VPFRWAGAVQTTCEYCHSILVRRDVSLEKVGVVAELPHDASPIQIGTEGVYRNKPFQVVGRILYEYQDGGWNEELSTGTGFPGVFYLQYHYYRHSFPVLALSSYLKAKGANGAYRS